MSLRIVRIAAGTTFQDHGRRGWSRFGVPVGGVFDRASYLLALQLVGRTEGEALEIPIPGGELVATESDHLALAGAGLGGELDGKAIPLNSSFDTRPGAKLSLKPAEIGLRAYLASARGWKVKLVLGSVSGVLPGEELLSASLPTTLSRLRIPVPAATNDGPIRIVPGPQARDSDLERIQTTDFKVSLQSNRVGIRVMGGQFESAQEFPSEPSCVGAIQLAPSGELLIHGPDGPSVAGYPKIAVVADVDRDRLAQFRPLQEVRFELISLEAAKQLSLENHQSPDCAE